MWTFSPGYAKNRRTHMKSGGKIVAWLCICSTLLMACYSSVMVEPTGVDRKKIFSGAIDYVIMKDDTKYEFEMPPTIVKESIIGLVEARVNGGIVTKQVSLPLSDVMYVHISELHPVDTALAVVGIIALGVVIWFLVAFYADPIS
jgi:hypothetical protein